MLCVLKDLYREVLETKESLFNFLMTHLGLLGEKIQKQRPLLTH